MQSQKINMWKSKITRDKDFNIDDYVEDLFQWIIERLKFYNTYFDNFK